MPSHKPEFSRCVRPYINNIQPGIPPSTQLVWVYSVYVQVQSPTGHWHVYNQPMTRRTNPETTVELYSVMLYKPVSTAPSPIDPVLTVQPDHCYIFFSLKNTFKNYFINYHNIIHLSLVRRIRQTLKTKPLIMLLYNYNLLIQRIPIQQP